MRRRDSSSGRATASGRTTARRGSRVGNVGVTRYVGREVGATPTGLGVGVRDVVGGAKRDDVLESALDGWVLVDELAHGEVGCLERGASVTDFAKAQRREDNLLSS